MRMVLIKILFSFMIEYILIFNYSIFPILLTFIKEFIYKNKNNIYIYTSLYRWQASIIGLIAVLYSRLMIMRFLLLVRPVMHSKRSLSLSLSLFISSKQSGLEEESIDRQRRIPFRSNVGQVGTPPVEFFPMD